VIGPAGLASCLPMAVVPGIHRWRRDLADRYDDRLHGRLVVTGAGHAGWCCQVFECPRIVAVSAGELQRRAFMMRGPQDAGGRP
jgi:hypothetical protein